MGAVLFFLGHIAVIVLWANHGTDTVGKITGTYRTKFRSSYDYYVKYIYSPPSRDPRHGRDEIYRNEYDRINTLGAGDSHDIPVRYLDVGFFVYSGRVGDVGLKLLFPIFWMCFTGVFCLVASYTGWIRPAREKAVVREGISLPGIITDKSIAGGRGFQSHYAHCLFEDRTGEKRQERLCIPEKHWEHTKVGQAVTVLVHPKNPKRLVIYEMSHYRVDETCSPEHDSLNTAYRREYTRTTL